MNKFLKLWKKYGMWALLIGLVIGFTLADSEKFFNETTLLNILRQAAVTGTCAVGVTFILITGQTDISVGPRVAFICVICANLLLSGVSIPVVVIIGILIGLLTGLLNAVLAEILHTYVFVVTIATMNIWTGACYVITGGKIIAGLPEEFKLISQFNFFGAVPSIIVIFLAMVVIGHFILSRTYFCRYVYALGGNREAAHLAGINTTKYNILTHAVGGIFIGVASMLLLSRTMTATANLGSSYAFDCITAACLGGVVLGGGRGTVLNATLGIIVISVMFNGLTIIGVNTYWQQVIKGILLLISIGIEVLQRYAKVDLSEKTALPEEIAEETELNQDSSVQNL